jgi:hypothetical protein
MLPMHRGSRVAADRSIGCKADVCACARCCHRDRCDHRCYQCTAAPELRRIVASAVKPMSERARGAEPDRSIGCKADVCACARCCHRDRCDHRCYQCTAAPGLQRIVASAVKPMSACALCCHRDRCDHRCYQCTAAPELHRIVASAVKPMSACARCCHRDRCDHRCYQCTAALELRRIVSQRNTTIRFSTDKTNLALIIQRTKTHAYKINT